LIADTAFHEMAKRHGSDARGILYAPERDIRDLLKSRLIGGDAENAWRHPNLYKKLTRLQDPVCEANQDYDWKLDDSRKCSSKRASTYNSDETGMMVPVSCFLIPDSTGPHGFCFRDFHPLSLQRP
jgi:hypothetical protein